MDLLADLRYSLALEETRAGTALKVAKCLVI
jgi:hypothetical protein